MRYSPIFLFLFGTVAAVAQVNQLPQLQAKYPSENAVFTIRQEVATVSPDANGINISIANKEDLVLLTDQVNGYNERKIYFSSFTSISNIVAKTFSADNNVTVARDIAITNEISPGTFFDDYKAHRVLFPNLQKGSKLSLSYVEKMTEPRFFSRYFFSSYAPTELSEYSVIAAEGVKLRWKMYGLKEGEYEYTQTTQGRNTIHTWRVKNVKRMDTEPDAPAYSYYAPHVVVLIDSYTWKGKTTQLLADEKALYTWYYSLVEKVNAEESPEVKKVADSLTHNLTSDAEKVKAVFYWVQDHIKYVAFEDGMGGFIPRESKLVCSRRFGDCKDMASIITSLCHAAGVKNVYLTWIGTRDIPYTYEDVPAPMSDNHMIATFVENGKYYFLDGTGRNLPFGTPTAMIQGKEALIGMGPDKFEVVKVPSIGIEQNRRIDTIEINVAKNMLQGTGKAVLAGYDKIDFAYRINGLNDQKKKDEYLTGLVSKGNNKFTSGDFITRYFTDRSRPAEVTYNWQLPDYARENGNEIYINMHLNKWFRNDLLDASKRSVARELEYKYHDTFVYILNIPAGYKPTYVPEGLRYEHPLFNFDIHYTAKNGKIICEQSVTINTLLITPADFDDWNKMVKQLNKIYTESVILEKIN